uniref:AviN n=1 Tax=Streptomyces viridochromogenes Tue57 TaxID=1160705 RepID=Q93KW7_STRVR|nr:AviN [Streptomyces viridochromogenes Tue57]
MQIADLYIGALGVFVPPCVSVEWAVERGLYPAEEAEAHELGGVAIAGDVPPPEMALRAAQQAVKRWGGSPTEFDLLLYASTWHQGPDGWPPQAYLQRHLVGGDMLALEIRQGCNGVFSALELAVGYLQADPNRTSALIVAADNYGTPLIDRWRMGPGFIGGDALPPWCCKRPGFARLCSVASKGLPEIESLHRGDEPLFPPSITRGRATDFSARIGQQFATRSPAFVAMAEIQDHMMDVAERALAGAGIGMADVARVSFMNYHAKWSSSAEWRPGGCRCPGPRGNSAGRSATCGASDHLLSMEHIVRTGELAPGDHVLQLATAPGLVVSSAVLQVLESPDWDE